MVERYTSPANRPMEAPGRVSDPIGQIVDLALEIRALELTLLRLHDEGRLEGTVHCCLGQELIAATIGVLADDPADFCYGSHRGHGFWHGFNRNPEAMLAELMGRPGGTAGSRGGTQHLVGARGITLAVQGQTASLAAGHATLASMNGPGSNVIFGQIGDGTLGQGAFYEALAWAGRYKPRLIFVLEDNEWAFSTHSSETFRGEVAARCRGFGVGYIRSSDTRPDSLFAACRRALTAARSHEPICLHIRTRRLAGHSRRSDSRLPEVQAAALRSDSLSRWIRSDPSIAERLHIQEERFRALSDEIDSRGPLPATRLAHEARTPLAGRIPRSKFAVNANLGTRISTALARTLADYPRVVLLGEDVRDPQGGLHGVTKGLSSAFPDRVINTSISEQQIVATTVSAVISGQPAIGEIMFGDFLGLAFDQLINVAAKLRFLGIENGTAILRVCNAGLGRGYGPTHCQNLDALLHLVPGLVTIDINPFLDIERIYRQAFHSKAGFLLMIESRSTYALSMARTLAALGSTKARSISFNEVVPDTLIGAGQNCSSAYLVTTGAGLADLEAASLDIDRNGLNVFLPSVMNARIADRLSLVAAKGDSVALYDYGPLPSSALMRAATELGARGYHVEYFGPADSPTPAFRTGEEMIPPRINAALQFLRVQVEHRNKH